jgi:PAS domain S-box-containing protein
MRLPLRILSLEDDPNDAELVHETLAGDGIACHITRVETEDGFIASLEQGGFDLVLADYTLPSFDGLSALKIARRDWSHLPFIFVSGTLDEEVAIEALKIGATDYVFKTRLSRIVPSVRRALRETEERVELSRAEEALRRSEAYLAEAQRLSHTGSFGWDISSGEIYWSRETFRVFQYEPSAKITIDLITQRTHPDDRSTVQHLIECAARERQEFDFEHRLLLPDGSVKYVRVVGHPSENESGGFAFVGAVTDITERKAAEADLRKALDEIKKLKDQLYEENVALKEEIAKASMFEEIVGESPALQAVLARVAKVAPTESTVLITGETGTGKELIARGIHNRSQRAARAFVSVNCAAIPSSLIASELFGHERGAFTGATQRRLGRFELAEGGTIFLDEIGELPPETQIALLRVLQEREFERVGGTKAIRSNVRVITATNRDLQAAINAGTFRSDLFYRLNVFPIEMPPLRERKEDIPLLVEYFIARYAAKAGKKIRGINRATLDRLKSYAWPGNIRELQNVIERSIIVCETENFTVDESWLSREPRQADQASRLVYKMSAAEEKKVIEVALADAGGRVSGPSGAAAKLGVPPSTLDSKIRTLKINKHRYKTA